eukprot:4876686-Amphidinium_carterae.1
MFFTNRTTPYSHRTINIDDISTAATSCASHVKEILLHYFLTFLTQEKSPEEGEASCANDHG